MTPAQLQQESFRSYQPEAKALAEKHLALLRTLPLSFLPLLLREVIAYDRKFPAERQELEHQFSYLESLKEAAREKELAPFRGIRVEGDLAGLNWVDEPARFSEALSAHLWSSHQIDGFHAAAVSYMDRASATLPVLLPRKPRLVVVVMGQGVHEPGMPLFRKLRTHGVRYTNVEPENGLSSIADWLRERAAQVPDRYAHWSISGSDSVTPLETGITNVSYAALAQPRATMSAVLRTSFEGGMNAESLRTRLAAMQPTDIGLDASADPPTTWFQLSLLSEGSGTQIFSTSFVQWAAREALRRAQPITMVCRYTPRVRSSSMKNLLSPQSAKIPVLDAEGSLVDADMAAYQTWLNLQRLSGAADSIFIGWFEGHREMLVIAPGMQPAIVDQRATSFRKISSDLKIA